MLFSCVCVCAVYSWHKDGIPRSEETTGACGPHRLSEGSNRPTISTFLCYSTSSTDAILFVANKTVRSSCFVRRSSGAY